MKSIIIFLVATLAAITAAGTLEYSTRALTSTHEGECRSCCLCNDVYALKKQAAEQKKILAEISTETKATEDQKEILDQLKTIKLMLEQITSVPLPPSTPPPSTPQPSTPPPSTPQPSTPPSTYQTTTAAVPTTTEPEIITDEGTAAASSEENSRNNASRAFTNSGERNYWANLSGQFPASVWMKYRNQHTLAKIGIRHNWVTSYGGYVPRKFEIIASNDCSSWTTLLTVEDGGYTYDNQMKTWEIPTQNRTPFSCIGVRWPTVAPANDYVTVNEIVMWE